MHGEGVIKGTELEQEIFEPSWLQKQVLGSHKLEQQGRL